MRSVWNVGVEQRFQDGVAGPLARAVSATLAENTPDDTYLLPDLNITDALGRRWHFDLVVLAPHAIYVVELHDWTGHVRGDRYQWTVDGRARWAPQEVANHKAQVLRHFLVSSDQRLAPAWVEPVTVLTQKPRSIDITTGGQSKVSGVMGLARLINAPELLPDTVARDLNAGEQAMLTLSRLAHTSTDPVVLSGYRVVDHLEASSGHDLFRVIPEVSEQAGEVEVRGHRLLRIDRGGDIAQLRARHEQWFELSGTRGLPEVVDLFEQDGLGAAMVYLEPEGRTLRALLHQGIDATEVTVFGWIRDIAEALAEAHAGGVVHGRIAPEHILITAQAAAHVRSPGPLGSPADDQAHHIDPAFVPPEVGTDSTSASPWNPAVDVFGLGAVIHYLFSGDTRWSAQDWPEYVPPQGCPESLRDLLPSMLEPDPAERLGSLEPLLDVLDELIAAQRRTVAFAGVPQVDPDDIVDGRYRVQHRLGIGPAWATFLLHDDATDTPMVGKVFDPVIRSAALNRIVRRTPADALVPEVSVVIDSQKRSWLISEFVEGKSLADVTMSGNPLAPAEAIAILDSLLQVFTEIHPDVRQIRELEAWGTAGLLRPEERSKLRELRAEGLVHGDIKPSSILRVQGGVALVDPLIRLDLEELPSPTHSYVDPIVTSSTERWDPSPDLYGAGVLLYEMICGAHPFESGAPSPGAEPTDPTTYVPGLDPELAGLLVRACSTNANDRFGDAAEMRRAFLSATQTVNDSTTLATTSLYRGFWELVQARAETHDAHWFVDNEIPEEWAVRFCTYPSGVALGARVLRRRVESVLEFPPEEIDRFTLALENHEQLEEAFGGSIAIDSDFRQLLVTVDGQVSDIEQRQRVAGLVADQSARLVAVADDVCGFVAAEPETTTTGLVELDREPTRKVSNRWVLDASPNADGSPKRANPRLFDQEAADDFESSDFNDDSTANEAAVIDLTDAGLAFTNSSWVHEASPEQRAFMHELASACWTLGGMATNSGDNVVLVWATRQQVKPLPILVLDQTGIMVRTDLLHEIAPFDTRRALRTLRHRLAALVETDWMGLDAPVSARLGWPLDQRDVLLQALEWIVSQIDVQGSDDLVTLKWLGEVLECGTEAATSEAAKMGLLIDNLPLITRRSAFVVAAEMGVVVDKLS